MNDPYAKTDAVEETSPPMSRPMRWFRRAATIAVLTLPACYPGCGGCGGSSSAGCGTTPLFTCAPSFGSSSGCGSSFGRPDATFTITDVGPRRDVQTPTNLISLFASCRFSNDCGSGYTCNTDYPLGLCTFRCAEDDDCGPDGVCAYDFSRQARQCHPACAGGVPRQCDRYGAACAEVFPTSNTSETVTACVPSCFPSGSPPHATYINRCVEALSCDPYRLTCVEQPGSHPGEGEVGGPCRSANDCKTGLCFTEYNPAGPTGFVGGYCSLFHARVPDVSIQDGALSRSNCPGGSIPVPLSAHAVEGDEAACHGGCMRSGESDVRGTCRDGYRCVALTSGDAPGSESGYCDPVDCNAPYAAPLFNHGCPPDHTCETTVGSDEGQGVCVGPTRDAGEDAEAPDDVAPLDDVLDETELDSGEPDAGDIDAEGD